MGEREVYQPEFDLEFVEPAKISPEYIVTKSNALIETPLYLDLHENRLVLAMISLIQPEDQEFNVVFLRVKDLAEILEIEEKNYYKKVREVVDQLLSKTLTIIENNGDTILKVNWLSSARYHNKKGFVELEFSSQLKPYLLQLKKDFTKYKLSNVLLLKSKYSIKMYELLKRYLKIGKRRFTLEQLRYLLEIDPDKLTHYGHFKARVLKKTQEELSKKTDISFTFEETKVGNRVTAITCHITGDNKLKISNPDEETHELEEDTAMELLLRFGVKRRVAEELIETYGEERIKENIQYVYDRKKNDDIDNVSGYIVKAIKENYVNSINGQYAEEDDLDMATSIMQLNQRIKRLIFMYKQLTRIKDRPENELKSEMVQQIVDELNKVIDARKAANQRPLTVNDLEEQYAKEAFNFMSQHLLQ